MRCLPENENCSSLRRIIIFAFVFIAVTCAAGRLIYKALYDRQFPFLKTDKRAQWILYPLSFAVDMRKDNYVNMTATFQKYFQIDSMPAPAILDVRAFENFTLLINDKNVFSTLNSNLNWKRPVTINIAPYLKKGINKIFIEVHCRYGPPAVWAYSDNLKELKTDSTWQVSLSGSPAVEAGVARDYAIYKKHFDSLKPFQMFWQKKMMLGMFFIISVAIFLSYGKIAAYVTRGSKKAGRLRFGPKTVLILAVCAWLMEFSYNWFKMPIQAGFDIESHLELITQVQSNWQIPLANQCWQGYQGPLFYFISAAVLSVSKWFCSEQQSMYVLKVIPFLCGLGLITVTFFAAKIIFPDCKIKQTMGTIFAAMIPMNIYISHYISNESMCGFLMALCIVLTLDILNSTNRLALKFSILGLVMGLSLLTKYTAIVLLPVTAFVIFYGLAFERKYSFRKIFGLLALQYLIVAVIAGWFYVRNYQHFGKFIIGNWDPNLLYAWWQDPGYHTYKYFWQFGKVFIYPYFAGCYSFWDSLYSTFWGDGQIGGRSFYIFKPPWNYQYMSSVYLLAVPATILIIAGMIRACCKLAGKDGSKWILISGSIFLILLSMISMELRFARYNQTKAFYGLFAVLPLSLLFACGFDLVLQFIKKFKIALLLLAGWFGVFVIAIFASFHVHQKQSDAITALSYVQQGNFDQAAKYYKSYIDFDPGDNEAYANLADIYASQGKIAEALENYKKTNGSIYDENPVSLSNWAIVILNKPQVSEDDKILALRYSQRACELGGYLNSRQVLNLATVYYFAGNTSQALKMAKRAQRLAQSADQTNIIQSSASDIEFYMKKLSDTKKGQIPQNKYEGSCGFD